MVVIQMYLIERRSKMRIEAGEELKAGREAETGEAGGGRQPFGLGIFCLGCLYSRWMYILVLLTCSLPSRLLIARASMTAFGVLLAIRLANCCNTIDFLDF